MVALFGIALTLSSCTATEQGALIGTGIGAGSGLAIGKRTSGALIGAGGGALLGALAGSAIDQHDKAKAQERRVSELEQQQRAQGVAGPASTDPTAGEVLNDTRWTVNVYVDSSSGQVRRTPTLVLMPRETKAYSMDLGQHRVMAEAFVSTQYGPRYVGKYDHVVNIDPKGSGWRVRFNENSFAE